MRKIFAFFVMVVFVLAVVFAEVDRDVEDFIKEVDKVSNIANKIESINEINFSDLPDKVNINNIDDGNLAMYEINVAGGAPVYVISAAKKLISNIKSSVGSFFGSDLIFRSEKIISRPSYIDGESGGYVMVGSGSIVGLSTSLDVLQGSKGEVEIIIEINSKQVGFRNNIEAEGGFKIDFDEISYGTINFKTGDVINIIVNVPEGVSVENVNSLIQIERRF